MLLYTVVLLTSSGRLEFPGPNRKRFLSLPPRSSANPPSPLLSSHAHPASLRLTTLCLQGVYLFTPLPPQVPSSFLLPEGSVPCSHVL